MTFVFGIILGIITGLGLALLITSCLVKDSNDIGDSIGKLENFGRLNILHEKMRLSSKGVTKDVISSKSSTLLQYSYDAAVKRAETEEQNIREAMEAKREAQIAQRDAKVAHLMGMTPPGVAPMMPQGNVAAAPPMVQPELPPVPEAPDMEYIDFDEVLDLLGDRISSDADSKKEPVPTTQE